MSRTFLKTTRLIHLYFGVFITPALLFFALTGAIQSFGLHETNRDHPNYKPAHWIAVLAQIHKKQVAAVPVRKPQPKAAELTPNSAAATPEPHPHRDHSSESPTLAAQPAPAAPVPTSAEPHHNPVPLRVFFVLVCLGLFSSTATGLYMTYQYTRNRRLITLTLLAGTILPPLLLLF